MCMQQSVQMRGTLVPGLLGLSILLTTDAQQEQAGTKSVVSLFGSPACYSAEAMYSVVVAASQRMHCSVASFMTAVVLLRRARLAVTEATLARTYMTALSVAVKWQDDSFCGNTAVAEVLGVSLKVMKQMEIAFLKAIDFECQVKEHEYALALSTCMEYERTAHLSLGLGGEPVRYYQKTRFAVRRTAASIGLLFKDSRIIGVVPRSASEAAGLSYGMVIKAINGRSISTQADVAEAIRTSAADILIDIYPTNAPCAPPRMCTAAAYPALLPGYGQAQCFGAAAITAP
eukprot:TRINITY_DN4215_c0_g2_i1.p1 TRINITY_DN4215_c0_g2~~TRINITY_DN4215_c0_g2_i1.p1  ORF type:complete len:288 (+),score=86.20 TRINITY_DN4215_c0_g2_i1:54-917(+)